MKKVSIFCDSPACKQVEILMIYASSNKNVLLGFKRFPEWVYKSDIEVFMDHMKTSMSNAEMKIDTRIKELRIKIKYLLIAEKKAKEESEAHADEVLYWTMIVEDLQQENEKTRKRFENMVQTND